MSTRRSRPARRRRPPNPSAAVADETTDHDDAALAPDPGGTLSRVVLLVEVWLLIVGIAVVAAPHSTSWLRVLGAVGVAGALGQLVADGSRRPPRLRLGRSHGGRPARTASLLATRDPELAARVDDALALLDGPVGQLVDADVVTSTRTAFAAGIHRADELYAQEIDVRASLATLGDSLRAADRSPAKDAQYTGQQADLTRLQAQRRRADDDLSAAASTLSKSLADAAFGKQRRAAGARLTVQRRRALSSDSAPDLVLARGSGALTELTDAVDGVRARLDAIRELDAMTDRFAPDAAEAEVDR